MVTARPREAPHTSTEGWTWLDNGANSYPVTADGPEVLDSWAVEDSVGTSGTYNYFPTPEQVDEGFANGWTLRARLRVVDPSDAVDYSVALEYANLNRRYSLRMGSNADGEPIFHLNGGPTLSFKGWGAGYHLVELVFDPDRHEAGQLRADRAMAKHRDHQRAEDPSNAVDGENIQRVVDV